MKNSSLIFLICVALTFIVFQTLAWPQYNEYKKLDAKVKDLNTNLSAILEHKKQTEEAYNKIMTGGFKYKDSYGQEKEIKYADITIDGKKKNSVLENALPDRMFKPALFNLYYTIAKSSGVEMDSISITESQKKRKVSNDGNSYEDNISRMGVASSDVTLTVIGPYQRFRDFLKGIEQSSRFIEVQNIEFSMPTKAKDKTKNIEDYFQFKLVTKVYYMNK
ncbi:MAG TPA: hypothetical protein PKL98_02230 [Candidatus Pacearchaeota archaeon]|nr:hypothetical protein [Candidatus Parcubacteria bacterium]HNZ84064.1 hypothetical protein [Candidatus Pacearchaeota archaeon]HPM08597.1 hypothetical protein [Candidatus Pacearchaeota archaeon]